MGFRFQGLETTWKKQMKNEAEAPRYRDIWGVGLRHYLPVVRGEMKGDHRPSQGLRVLSTEGRY